ncbi:TonB-dependent receptor domain-containing protein [Asticcacaulis sp. AND118]|uniref:TonB-dependent receptor domain-containing protein n=1 Tax=Asticcacaulis sp. AND118 TaxID=2840468 RepID=UPI001CFF843B|nr:TonB-dependent receptor [Asticcacaulis sp. AND118]UDF05275.1 TonB-dependent receptor [Asticcacaulis sp. AND118]
MTTKAMHGRSASAILRKSVSVSALTSVLALTAMGAQAQEAAPATPASDDIQTVVVTGYRASLQSALTTKRKADVMMDAINAEDIADFPDANLAESLQRIPGISIDRDNGEGRTITVRGLGADFTRVRINGLEALSTAGANDAGSNPNRSRAFDFNTFASELFNSLRVRKTSSAETDEGSLGATVDLITGRPFDYKKDQYAFSIQDAYYDNGGFHNPRVTGLVSRRWADGKLGFLASVAYSERDSENDQYRRGPGQSDYLYRNATWATNEYPLRAGFAAPAGTTFNDTILAAAGPCPGTTTPSRPIGYVCTGAPAITNTAYYNAVTGSDPAAYALLHNPLNASQVRFPALGSIEQQDLHQERLGLTASFQMQPNPGTRISIDGLYSKFRNESTIYQVSSVGLNRDNTNAQYATAVNNDAAASTGAISGANPGTKLTVAQKRGLYPGTCTARAATDIQAAIDCGQSFYGGGLVSGMGFSYNPKNLDPYDYYTNPNSVGYVASADGLGFRDKLIGRQGVDVLAANVSNGVADYLVLRNVDWRSAADRNFYTTEFKQLSFNLTQEFSDRLRGDFTLGASESYNENQGLLVEFNRMDSPESFVFDERGGGEMPVFNIGFDAANPANWNMVKGFSAIRHYQRFVTNEYKGAKADFTYDLNDNLTLKFGGTSRQYGFETNLLERESDLLNPTEKEAGVSVASLGKVIQFGQGLDVPGGTATSFFAPSIEAFNSVFDFTCNCINQYGDWRIHGKRNGGRENFKVQEKSEGAYLQLNFDYDVLGGNIFGNIGVRQVKTDLTSYGTTSAGRPITGRNEYTDTLPSFNVAWEVIPNVYVRAGAAEVMARPQLGNLSPSITAISIPSTTGATTGATLTIGNPKLAPFRGKTYDLSAEWYFAKGGLLSLAVFKKDIESYPQTVLFSAPLSTFLSADDLATLKLQFNTGSVADNARLAYIDSNGEATARQFRDAPGGTLEGYEFSYQQDFTFLPWLFRNTGVQFNLTHIESELTYILDPGSATVAPSYGAGPWLGASPDAINLTLYYETEKFSARVSMAKREGYYTTYPLAAGSCAPGLNSDGTPCNSPLINDFAGSLPTENVDFSMSYKPTRNLTVTLEGLNMTNETTNRYAYGGTSQTVVSQYGSTGRQFTLGVRYKY